MIFLQKNWEKPAHQGSLSQRGNNCLSWPYLLTTSLVDSPNF
ncbi:hypothetical protein LDG_7158 [Legionella drancourtii LLAP12]|uniref:Uncharacterized protein n=1 Tax=Legionella drancourtii LLAP12 TaxID=658187 RepID=G9EPH4_9GAMM|nr:hypothetical protein LDG_7158 [Legionella drancourtii LLAP12]